jgi:hypothetical protein
MVAARLTPRRPVRLAWRADGYIIREAERITLTRKGEMI